MCEEIRLETISQVHEMLGMAPPQHPLVSLIESSDDTPLRPRVSLVDRTIVSELYSVSLKDGTECAVRYGRRDYDFQAGSLMFVAPHQAVIPVTDPGDLEAAGESWTLMFHPDLIRSSPLAVRIRDCTFFSYASHEALHLSARERDTIGDLVKRIRDEYRQNLDEHSHELIVSNIDLLLSYCKRFYGRQFLTRSHVHKDVVTRLEAFLRGYFDSGDPEARGIPTAGDCARHLGYSPNYLADMLRKETGRSTREHIHTCLLDRAKEQLLGSEETISRIAYSLGFEYPGHFSKLFKSKTGLSPKAYRAQGPEPGGTP